MNRSRAAVTLLVVLSLAVEARADQSPDPDSVSGIAPPPAEPASENFSIAPFGYLRILGSLVQDDRNVAFVGRADGFELQNARIGFDGRLRERVSFRLSIDGAVDHRDHANDTNGNLEVGLRDAYADLHVAPSVTIRAGRAYPMFDIEELIGTGRRPFPTRALPSRGVRATDGWETPSLSPRRSIGVALRHDPGPTDKGVAPGWEIAAQNGAADLASDNDNDAVALSAAALLRFPNDGMAVVGVRWNPRTEGELPVQQDETDLQGSAGAWVGLGPATVGAGLIVERTVFETTGGLTENSFGGWGAALFRLPVPGHMVDVGYRFGILEPSDLIDTDRVVEHTVGGVWSLPASHLRLLVHGTAVVEQSARDLSNNRIESVLELSL